ncbi:hypothetical protein C2G38_2047265 [Gigaspora rosea]|uniref:MD-2-related lipid-recognition domain-containing protein n=1 Tax=Gigaspora rosea TaxID=44941 RepID=A0A397U6C0_9GLOM|nr:hypothetical protein C2G38_2047265 [Gigaspora rosea]
MNFIFAFILFALLTVNAAPFQLSKRAITFGSCGDAHEPIPLLNVKIGTNPPESEKSESFEVSGKVTKVDIPDQATINIVYFDNDRKNLGNYFKTFNETIKAGTPFKISLSDVPTPRLPHSYELKVYVDDESTLACANAIVG